jgi:hypothetical protein
MVHVPSRSFSARASSFVWAPILAAGFIWSAQGLGRLGAGPVDGHPVLLAIGLAVTILAFGWLHFTGGPQMPRGGKRNGG